MTVNNTSDWLIHNLGTVIIPNRTSLVRFGSISGEFGRAMVNILARRSRDQTSLICCRSVPKKVRLGIYRTQIRPKTRRYFFVLASARQCSGVQFWREIVFFSLLELNSFFFPALSLALFFARAPLSERLEQANVRVLRFFVFLL